jgi:alpha-mannosidase
MTTVCLSPLRASCLALLALAPFARSADYDDKSTVPTAGALTDAAVKKGETKGLEEVILVYKTHFDIGYTSTAHEVVHDYRTEMADRLMDAIERNKNQPKEKQFVWTLSGYPMQQVLWEGQTPERRAQIEGALKSGNIALHGLAVSLHAEMMEPEDAVRAGLGISSKIARKYGRPLPTGAKMSDVPGQTWLFPTLFKHAGMKFYHMGGPLVNLPFNLPPAFWWEGPDGSRLLTLYNNGYGSAPMPHKGWNHKTWVHINMTGDNQGPPSPEQLQKDLDAYAKRGVKVRVGSMDDFAEALLKEDLSDLPVVRGDIPDPWLHGVMSQPAAVKLARNELPKIGAMEALTLQESACWGVFRPDVSAKANEAYERSIRFSEHTFGMANQHYCKQPFGKNGADWYRFREEGMNNGAKLQEASWKEKARCVEDAVRLTAEPYADALLTLSDNVAQGGGRVVVYNPLPWKRDGEIVVNCFHLKPGTSLKPVDGGPSVPVAFDPAAIEDNPSRVRRAIVKDIPPMGYRTYVFTDEKPAPSGLSADKAAGVIESPYFRAKFDPKLGRIVSLVDKRSGRELVDAAAPQGFGQYLYERFSYKQLNDWLTKSIYPQYPAHRFSYCAYDMPKDGEYASALPADMTFSVEQSPVEITAVMTGTLPGGAIGNPQKVSIRLTLPAATPAADLDVSWQKDPDGWPEYGWICLPFKVDNPRFRVGKLGGDLDPVKDLTLDNINYHNLWVNTGVAVYDDKTGAGVGVCPIDSPMVSLGEPGGYKFEKRYEPKNPYVYVQLYNNHWRTNFCSWIGNGERMSSRVRLWAFDKYDTETSLYTPSMEARQPLAAARSEGRAGKLPVTQAGVTPSRRGVMVTAFCKNPDGAGSLLRLWEQAGTSGALTVKLPAGAPFKTATPVNLRGEKTGEPVSIKENAITLDLPAYAPASYVLE